MPHRLASLLRRFRTQTAWSWIALGVFVAGFVVLPFLHSLHHRHDHTHAPAAASAPAAPWSVAAATRWIFGEPPPELLPLRRHGAEPAPTPTPAELIALARSAPEEPLADAPPHDGDDERPLDHGAHSPLHLSAALVATLTFAFHLPPPPEVLLPAPAELEVRFISIAPLDRTQARAPPRLV